ncbi:Putative glycosyltransferase [Croceitalea dokdonensis DOKDO 023]|uniref:Putative glycosyltransferase n=1 Tax=Croceitalea dokdonensis DOKDO 023 TaxID=1300341 RepID=A0A0P7AJM8_9FLAO|nr:GT4 family glycosyltransferase PelF [Croceitalea dokdonensis]KPM32024.1 Putative glycosyltransferase [Croceitalea dokdonensis DOKDO 023]
MEHKKNVLLITEGTYPYMGGGVSTWAHHLTQRITGYDFSIYSLNADVVDEPKFVLGSSVKEVLQVPMWAPEEPYDCVDYNQKYSQILLRRERTNAAVIINRFLPHFKKFLAYTFFPETTQDDAEQSGLLEAFQRMWSFFEVYDYKTTMVSEQVWSCFKNNLIAHWPKQEMAGVKLMDLTMALRLLFRYLIPLAIKVPKSDVSHLTIAGIGIIPALKQKQQFGNPIILTEHGVFIRERMIAISNTDYSQFLKKVLIRFSEAMTRLTYAQSDKIISVSKFNVIWEQRYGADVSRIQVIYNGVDHQLFAPQEDSTKKERPTVVAAARIFELKDILTMIKTCAYVKKTIPNVHFLVYGDKTAVPDYTQSCEAMIAKLGVKANFSLAGYHDTPSALFHEGDISILTSISEGFPFTVIESMSCGIPIVATDVGGVAEAIEDGVTGFICKPKDHKSLGKRVVQLLDDVKLREQMGANARNKVLESFTIEKFTESFSNAYAEVLDTPKLKSLKKKDKGKKNKKDKKGSKDRKKKQKKSTKSVQTI